MLTNIICHDLCILGDYRFTMLQLLSFIKWQFTPYFNHQRQYIITSCWQEKVGFWPMNELIHHPWQYLFTYSEEVSYESYHSDIKYHMTLTIIFSVVTCWHLLVFFTIVRFILQIPLKWWRIFLKSWTSTGSYVTSGQFSLFNWSPSPWSFKKLIH